MEVTGPQEVRERSSFWTLRPPLFQQPCRSSTLPPVTSWIVIALLVGIVGVGFAVTRFRRSRGISLFELGEVSQAWITEQRLDKRSDR